MSVPEAELVSVTDERVTWTACFDTEVIMSQVLNASLGFTVKTYRNCRRPAETVRMGFIILAGSIWAKPVG